MEAYDLVESPSAVVSPYRASLRLENPEINISLYKGSLKQLLPVSSYVRHRSNVRFTNAEAACLAILLLELFPPVALGPQQVYQGITISIMHAKNLNCTLNSVSNVTSLWHEGT